MCVVIVYSTVILTHGSTSAIANLIWQQLILLVRDLMIELPLKFSTD